MNKASSVYVLFLNPAFPQRHCILIINVVNPIISIIIKISKFRKSNTNKIKNEKMYSTLRRIHSHHQIQLLLSLIYSCMILYSPIFFKKKISKNMRWKLFCKWNVVLCTCNALFVILVKTISVETLFFFPFLSYCVYTNITPSKMYRTTTATTTITHQQPTIM